MPAPGTGGSSLADEIQYVGGGVTVVEERTNIDRFSALLEADDVERYARRAQRHEEVGDAETAASTVRTVRR